MYISIYDATPGLMRCLVSDLRDAGIYKYIYIYNCICIDIDIDIGRLICMCVYILDGQIYISEYIPNTPCFLFFV